MFPNEIQHCYPKVKRLPWKQTDEEILANLARELLQGGCGACSEVEIALRSRREGFSACVK